VTILKGVVLGLLTKAAVDMLERRLGPDWPDKAFNSAAGFVRGAASTVQHVARPTRS
jgi:hypothetical protein